MAGPRTLVAPGAGADPVPTPDSDVLPRGSRRAAMLRLVDAMAPGDSLPLTTREDPVALIAEIEQRHPGTFSFWDLQAGPGCWRFVLRR